MRKLLLLVALAFAVLGAACSKAEPKVTVTLKEMTVATSVSTVPAGKVTFEVKNAGTITHEMIVMKTNVAPGSLPVKDGKVDEEGKDASSVGEVSEFAAGKTISKSFDLKPGSYELVCNIAGHYAGGMHAPFKVT